MDPDYHSLYLYLAKSLEHEEQLDEAIKVAKEGIAVDEYNKDLNFYAGKLSLKEGTNKRPRNFSEKRSH